jgi:predicted dienelactone hydrolase
MLRLLRRTRFLIFAFSALLAATHAANASQAGFRRINIAAPAPGAAPIVVALYYPTQAVERTVNLGPFTQRVAMGGQPEDKVKGLILLSHGTGGSEVGHTSLAEGLARQGYLVAALRHPGDNWQDLSLRQTSLQNYFSTRPQQASHVISALLNDPEWKDRIASDAKGPRVGALGHSAGGYTVLALAGARPDASRFASHCAQHRMDDPIFCGIGGKQARTTASAAAPPLADARVRAVVAMAPAGAVFSAASFADVKVPIAIYSADKDRFLVPRFHAEWVARNFPTAQFHHVPNALHFAFMDTPTMAIATEDGDVATDLPGFKRQDFLRQLQREIPDFFDKAFR